MNSTINAIPMRPPWRSTPMPAPSAVNMATVDSAQKVLQLPAFDPAVQLTLVSALAAVKQDGQLTANVEVDANISGTPLHTGFMVTQQPDGKVRAAGGGVVANNLFSSDLLQTDRSGYAWGGRYGNNFTNLHIEPINLAASVNGSVGNEAVSVNITPNYQPGTQTMTGFVAFGQIGGENYMATTRAETLDGQPADLKALLRGEVAGRLVERGSLNNLFTREGQEIEKYYEVKVSEHPGEQKFREVTLHGTGNNAGLPEEVTVQYVLSKN
jgi:hypothetical protein